ncbi:Actin-1 [Wickerhamomyces ciferrii]|uniref:Actin-1 n=1 Tax=Wickerhamomyces ciferrii (strain ATCC 14091 / BCRC 22168 / CBS 111 / JCM 3599 / NBRC 0793 / NRRL Y-1031 F-60-10) TaxID=1206466 RepID=K0KEZ9_WICCF|nr:Actin-1 [Wickerhamomyces ciferrii]CCH41536.1 Actin-1 [Wickerhamomyces ciferrii]
MSHQYYPVVLQLGARTIHAGFAGDAVPTIRSVTNAYDLKDAQVDQNDGLNHASDQRLEVEVNDIDFRGNVLWDNDLVGYDFPQLERLLERIIYDIYQNNLLVDAKKCKVLILEPPFFPIPLKKMLTKVLLFHIHAQSVRFFPEPVLSSISSGSNNALVIDMGWCQSTITAVFDLRILYKESRVTNRAGKNFHAFVRTNLKENGIDSLSFDFVEDLICDTFYCNPHTILEEEEKYSTFTYNGISIPNKLRYNLIDQFFFENGLKPNVDDENNFLVPLIKGLKKQLPIDLRSTLFTNIIFTGGLTKIPGMKTRILNELQIESESKIEALEALGPWAGASLYCSTSLMSPSTTAGSKKSDELLRDRYLNGESILQDWTDQLYN